MTASKSKEVQLAPTNDAAALMQIISRAATDSAIDIDKMERLFKMHGEIVARSAEMAFNTALSAVQAKSRRVEADASNPQTSSKYASYAALDRALRPLYTEEGFSLSFDTGDAPAPEQVRIVCYVSHSGGHSRKYHIDMPADGKGAKGGLVMTLTHATGAATAYGMRYLLKMIFNIAVGEDDDDGNLGAKKMDGVVYHNYVVAIDALKDKKEAAELWKNIAADCKASGDKETYNDLKALITLKGESLS
jgi:hypothetical protein